MALTVRKRTQYKIKLTAAVLAFGAFAISPPANSEESRGFDDESVAFINKLALNPALINVEYLSVLFGNPTQAKSQPGSPIHHYWQVPGFKGPKYELVSHQSYPGDVSHARFIVHQPAKRASFKDVEAAFGEMPVRRFDQQSRPIEIFSLRPDTSITFTKPQNTFQISQVSIEYNGPPLPPPSVFDVMAARDLRYQKIVNLHENKQWGPSIENLRAHLKENPSDGQSHLMLARAYKETFAIPQAVMHYSMALSLSGGNQELYDQAMAGLSELRVMPLTQAEIDQLHELKLVQNEQRLRQGRLAAKDNAQKGKQPSWLSGVPQLDPPAHMFAPGSVRPLETTAPMRPNQAAPIIQPSTKQIQPADLKPMLPSSEPF